MRYLAMLALLSGCAADGVIAASDTGAPRPPADDAVTTPTCDWTYEEIAVDRAPPPEVVAVVQTLSGPRSATLEWLSTNARTELSFELSAPTAYRIGESATEDDSCASHVLIDLTLAFATADGLLDEVLDVTVRGEQEHVRLEHWVPVESLAGSWEPPAGGGSWDGVDLEIAADVTADTSSGSLSVYAVRTVDGRQEVLETPAATWPTAHIGR